MPDMDKLKGVMYEKHCTYADGAKACGCSVTAFSNKINGKSNFTVIEANSLSEHLGLSLEARSHIFLR